MHPYFQYLMARQHVDELLRDAQRARLAKEAREAPTEGDGRRVVLRVGRVGDGPALERLAALEGAPAPDGSFVLAELDGAVVAALPLDGGSFLADPFVPTRHLRRLLELRRSQLREPAHGIRRFAAAHSRLA